MPPVFHAGSLINAEDLKGWVSFSPYSQITYQMATFNGTGEINYDSTAAPFHGLIRTRTITPLDETAYFPKRDDDQQKRRQETNRPKNKISVPANNVLYSAPRDGGRIALGTYVTIGLQIEFSFFRDMMEWKYDLPDVCVLHPFF